MVCSTRPSFRVISSEERGRDPEDHGTLDLRLYGVGIHDRTAIDRADDTPDADLAILRHLDFGDLRHIGPEDELERDAAA